MMKKCRVYMAVLLVVFMGFSVCICPASAVSENMVYAECFMVEPGQKVNVPVYIKNNTGLMGFSIYLNFDGAALIPVKVTRGQLVNAGLFDDSIGTGDADSIKVIWSSTENINADGELFSVEFFAPEDALTGTYTLNLSYEPRDTFNESWSNVELTIGDTPAEVEIDFGLLSISCFKEFSKLALLLISYSSMLASVGF